MNYSSLKPPLKENSNKNECKQQPKAQNGVVENGIWKDDHSLSTVKVSNTSTNREEDAQRSFEQWLAGALPRDAPALSMLTLIGGLRLYAGQRYRRDEFAQALEGLGLDANTINAGFVHAINLSLYPEIWDRILLFPNSDSAAAVARPLASVEATGRTTDSVMSSLSSGSSARYSPTRMMGDRLATIGIAMSSQSRSAPDGSAPSFPSLPTPVLEDFVDAQAPRRSRDDYDRIPPGGSFSNPTNDQVPDTSREAVASNEITPLEAGGGIQSQEFGATEEVAPNELPSQDAVDGIQSQEAVHGIKSGATAAPSGNVPATNSCCIIL